MEHGSVIKMAEFMALVLTCFLAVFVAMVAHYKPIIEARRVQWGMVGIAFVIAFDRLMLLWHVLSPEAILAFGGVAIGSIILLTHWKVIWHFFKEDK